MKWWLAAFVVPSLLVASSGRAQSGPGTSLQLFRPAVDSKGWMGVDGTDVLGRGHLSLGLILDGAFGLVDTDAFVNDRSVPAEHAVRVDRLVDHLFTGTLVGNVGLSEAWTVGGQVPVVVASGPNVSLPGQYNDGPNPTGLDHQGLGDVSIHTKLRLLDGTRNPVGLAAVLRVGLPTGDADAFIGEPGFWLTPKLVLEARPLRRLRLGVELGYRVVAGTGGPLRVGAHTVPGGGTAAQGARFVDGQGEDVTHGDGALAGVGFGLRVAEAVELVAEARAAQLVNDLGDRGTLSAEALGGLKVFVERNSYLTVAGGAGLTHGVASPDARLVLGFVFEPSVGDRDGDGYRNDADECPGEPEDFDGFEDDDGCPDPDNDADGFLDVDDLCPDHPEDRDGHDDGDGCPDPDNDDDRILDVGDTCPNEPERYNGFEDEDGCDDRGILEVGTGGFVLFEKIHFETDSARILPRSDRLLDAIAAALFGHPEVTLVEIQGHADERGTDAYNIRLTRDRAAAVREALRARGVPPERMRSAGYGERCPARPGRGPAAWERNRRVEIRIVRTVDGPTNAPLVCPAGRALAPR